MAIRHMGVAVKGCLRTAFAGIRQKQADGALDLMVMSVGHIKLHTAHHIIENPRCKGRTAVFIAVARHLMEHKVRILLRQSLGIIVVISQMDHRIRLHAIIIAGILTGGNRMQKNSQDFSMQEALRLANSPAGQQLLAMLRETDSARLEQAAAEASSGDYTKASQTLSSLLSSPEIQKLLKELGG